MIRKLPNFRLGKVALERSGERVLILFRALTVQNVPFLGTLIEGFESERSTWLSGSRSSMGVKGSLSENKVANAHCIF